MIFLVCYASIIKQYRVAGKSKVHAQNMDDSSEEGEAMNIEDVVWYHKVMTSRTITMVRQFLFLNFNIYAKTVLVILSF